MFKNLFPSVVFVLIFLILIRQAFSQAPACKKEALTALRPIPELKYKCRDSVNGYEDEILKFPERILALKSYAAALERLVFADWWNASVDDLTVCDFRKKPGRLTKEERQDYEGGTYPFNLMGRGRIRIIIAGDPCYQTGYGGSSLFLLNRQGGRVYASEIIDGFYSRADNPASVDFAASETGQIIEITTTSGGLSPTITNYYFTIDKKIGKAIPARLFKADGGKLTNQITSTMLMENSDDYGLPAGLEPLKIIKNNRLAKRFDVFRDTGETFGPDNHRKLERLTLRWNGKFYE